MARLLYMSRDVRFLETSPLIPGHLRDLGNYFHRGSSLGSSGWRYFSYDSCASVTSLPPYSSPEPVTDPSTVRRSAHIRYPTGIPLRSLFHTNLVFLDLLIAALFHMMSSFLLLIVASLNNIHILSLRLIKRPPVNLVGRKLWRIKCALDKVVYSLTR